MNDQLAQKIVDELVKINKQLEDISHSLFELRTGPGSDK